MVIHALGQPMGEEEQYYSPKELHVIFREARVYSALYCLVFAVSVYTQSLAGGEALAGADVYDEVGTFSAWFIRALWPAQCG